jgi:hypothetical protein
VKHDITQDLSKLRKRSHSASAPDGIAGVPRDDLEPPDQ